MQISGEAFGWAENGVGEAHELAEVGMAQLPAARRRSLVGEARIPARSPVVGAFTQRGVGPHEVYERTCKVVVVHREQNGEASILRQRDDPRRDAEQVVDVDDGRPDFVQCPQERLLDRLMAREEALESDPTAHDPVDVSFVPETGPSREVSRRNSR